MEEIQPVFTEKLRVNIQENQYQYCFLHTPDYQLFDAKNRMNDCSFQYSCTCLRLLVDTFKEDITFFATEKYEFEKYDNQKYWQHMDTSV